MQRLPAMREESDWIISAAFGHSNEFDDTHLHEISNRRIMVLQTIPLDHSGILSICCGTSRNRTTFTGFSVQRIHHVCQSSKCGSRRIRTFGPIRIGTLAVCWFKPLTHTSLSLTMQRYGPRMQPICVPQEKQHFSSKKLVLLYFPCPKP
jgi:hypothetical protein